MCALKRKQLERLEAAMIGNFTLTEEELKHLEEPYVFLRDLLKQPLSADRASQQVRTARCSPPRVKFKQTFPRGRSAPCAAYESMYTLDFM